MLTPTHSSTALPVTECRRSAALGPLHGHLLAQLAGALLRELEQPVTALLNEADSADLLMRQGALREARACVGQIRLLGEQLAELLSQLKDNAWRPGGTRKPTDLRESLDLALRALGIFEGRHANGVAVQLLVAPHGPVIVMAQPGRLEQVLVNLLRNALEATAQQGSAGCVEVRIFREGGGIQVSVSDNGPGLSPAVLPHLFEPFFTTKQDGPHLGMALVISRLIAEDLGGGLSACNGGTGGAGGAVFNLWLPVAGDGPDS